MKALHILLLMVLLVSGCTRHVDESSPLVNPGIASTLNNRYNDIRQNCGDDSKPAFLCAGVVLRATGDSAGFDFWNPSPGSVSRGGVSFSYLRKDANFTTTVTGTVKGYIAYPVLQAPPETAKGFDYLCAFPIDGATANRTDRGCGPHSYYPSQSRYCSVLGITTAEKFYAHYMQQTNPSHRKFYQCSFDIRDASNALAGPAFYQMIRSMKMIPREALNDQNELVVKTWAQNIPSQLPIEALFYLEANSAGLTQVRHDQTRFKAATGKTIPIVRLKLPANHQGAALFSYDPADQVFR